MKEWKEYYTLVSPGSLANETDENKFESEEGSESGDDSEDEDEDEGGGNTTEENDD
jgi:hypothetical protein